MYACACDRTQEEEPTIPIPVLYCIAERPTPGPRPLLSIDGGAATGYDTEPQV